MSKEDPELTTAQKSALWMIWKLAIDGVQSNGHAKLTNGKWHKFDARTLLSLCARGFLEGRQNMLRVSDAGIARAQTL